MIKFTKLEVETITDRPEDCITEHLCQDQHGKKNTTNEIWIEYREGHNGKLYENKVYPEQMTEDAISDIYYSLNKTRTVPEPLTELHKEILDNERAFGEKSNSISQTHLQKYVIPFEEKRDEVKELMTPIPLLSLLA